MTLYVHRGSCKYCTIGVSETISWLLINPPPHHLKKIQLNVFYGAHIKMKPSQ